MRERDHLKDLGIDWRISKNRTRGMDWIDLAEHRQRWWGVLNM
jgi:hypothetical protein